MSFSAGVFSINSAGQPVVTGTVISSTAFNAFTADIATGLSTCVLKDGTQTITANIPMSTFKLTGLGAGTATGNSVRYEQFFPTFNTTGPVNETKTTVASAAGPDIWTLIGNVVDYTGTVTATSFAAAPQAGSRRTLVCAAAAPFTAGANMLIQGYASGSTFTAAAGDQIDVVAITTTQFRLVILPNAGTPIVGTSIPRSYLDGLTMSTAGSSATMSVAAGQATDSTNAAVMNLAASISKTTSAWSVGSAAGGLDTGAIANGTWYHFFEIMRPDTGVVDVLFSLSATAPTMPTSYTLKRRIGAGLTNGSAQWVAFNQINDYFEISVPVLETTSANPGTSAVTQTLANVPTGVKVTSMLEVATTGANTLAYLSNLSTTDAAPSATAAPGGSTGSTTGQPTQVRVITNTSAQIRTRINSSGGGQQLVIVTLGWWDPRGRDA